MSFPGRLYLLFTPSLCRQDPWATLSGAISGGVDLVQWRSKEADPSGYLRCRDLCRRRGVPLLVNDDVMLGAPGLSATSSAWSSTSKHRRAAPAARSKSHPTEVMESMGW